MKIDGASNLARPILHVARADATVWPGSPDHGSKVGSASRKFSTSQEQRKYEGSTVWIRGSVRNNPN